MRKLIPVQISRPSRWISRLSLLLAAMLLAGGALAQAYKWVDKDGRVRYGDRPPPGVNAKALQAPSGPASSSSSSTATPQRLTPAEQEAAFRKRRIEAQKAEEERAKEAAAEKQRQENCAGAKRQLTALESGQRIARFDANGERQYLEDADRPAEIARARKLVADWCN